MIRLLKKTDSIILGLSAFAVVLAIGYAVWLSNERSVSMVSSSAELTLDSAFQESGAEPVSVSARCWEQIDQKFHDSSDMAMYFAAICEVIGDDDLLSFDEYDDHGYAGFSISGITEQGYNLNLVVQSLGERNVEDETYIIAEISKEGNTNIEDLRNYLNGVFASINCRCEPYFMMEGKYDVLLSKREKKRVSKKIFALMDGKVEEKISDGNYVSFSGYTEHLDGSVSSSDHKINLQTALSDNEEEGSTYIHIGTPVVFSDF